MQYEFVQLSTAQIFNRRFYQETANGVTVDVAVNRARNAISASGDLLAQRDWSTPVLYLGTRSGRLITLERDQASRVEWAAQSVQAVAMQDAAAAEGWRELQQTFEALRASHFALSSLTGTRELVAQARSDFDALVDAAAHGIGGVEFGRIKHDWEQMTGSTVARLRDASPRLTDGSAKAELQRLINRFDAIDAALDKLAVGDLETEIVATRRALAEVDAGLGRRINETIIGLFAASERTLGRLSVQS
jgi:hypothetical protein